MSKKIEFKILPQYVRHTGVKERFKERDGVFEGNMHFTQKIMRDEFNKLPLFNFFYAPTGTGKSYSFCFPVLKDKANKKGLLILPTNTLIDELHENFSETFTELNIAKLTGKALDEAGKKGSNQRWKYCLEMANDNHIVVTNPDILNYAMHGGYDKNISDSRTKYFQKGKRVKNTGGQTIIHLLREFDYLVFDEFHLYDEEQIANILTLVKLRGFFLEEAARIFFVSATPEKKVETLLETEGIQLMDIETCIQKETNLSKEHYTILEDRVIQTADQARKIKDEMLVTMVADDNYLDIILSFKENIQERIDKGEKVLIIFNALADLKKNLTALKEHFSPEQIRLITGYHPDHNPKGLLILGTSKVEVGANLGVDFGIMQAGFSSRSCIQRFGRYARGGKTGHVVIGFDQSQGGKSKKAGRVLLNAIVKHFEQKGHHSNQQFEIPYQGFVENIKTSMGEMDFYDKKIPLLIGEYFFAITQNFTTYNNYETADIFKTIVTPDKLPELSKSRYKYFQSIAAKIASYKKEYTTEWRQWQQWWEHYLETYLTFRGSMPTVEVIDLELPADQQQTKYSLEWLLMHKEIVDKKESKQGVILVVDGMKASKDLDIQYEVITIPHVGQQDNCFLPYKERLRPNKYFDQVIKKMTDNGNGRSTEAFAPLQKQLCQHIKGLSATFSEKRMKVVNIRGNDRNFL